MQVSIENCTERQILRQIAVELRIVQRCNMAVQNGFDGYDMKVQMQLDKSKWLQQPQQTLKCIFHRVSSCCRKECTSFPTLITGDSQFGSYSFFSCCCRKPNVWECTYELFASRPLGSECRGQYLAFVKLQKGK